MNERTGEIDILGILKKIPHRYPFVMVDKVESIEDKKIVAYKNVSFNEWYFQGHFPAEPVMPGVLILEGMAQSGAILLSERLHLPDNVLMYFMTIDKVKFRQKVVPGDKLVYEIEIIHMVEDEIAPRGKFQGKAFVSGNVVAEAQMSAIGKVKDI